MVIFLSSCLNGVTNDVGAPSKKRETQTTESSGNLTDVTDRFEDNENEEDVIDEPVMVSGAFLACSVEKRVRTKAGHVAAGCRVLHRESGQKLPMSSNIHSEVEFFNVYNMKVQARTADAPASSPYHWLIEIPQDEIVDSKVQVMLVHKPSGVARSKVAPVEGWKDDGTTKKPDAQIGELGKVTDFHLGDNNYTSHLNKDCVDDLQRIGYSGKTLVVPFRILNGSTKVGISFDGICGINRYGNAALIRRGGNTNQIKAFTRYTRTLVMDGFVAEPGDYLLEIHSKLRGSDYDDFVIGNIIFSTDKTIEIGEPWTERPTTTGGGTSDGNSGGTGEDRGDDDQDSGGGLDIPPPLDKPKPNSVDDGNKTQTEPSESTESTLESRDTPKQDDGGNDIPDQIDFKDNEEEETGDQSDAGSNSNPSGSDGGATSDEGGTQSPPQLPQT